MLFETMKIYFRKIMVWKPKKEKLFVVCNVVNEVRILYNLVSKNIQERNDINA